MISRLNSLRDARKDRHVGIGELEANWTDIVKKEGLSRRCAEQQAAIWEIVTTEYRYLQVFIIIYLASFFRIIFSYYETWTTFGFHSPSFRNRDF